MKYAKIRKMDISNGEGVRVSLFVQGCSFHCKNCFNQETWDFNGGKEFTTAEIQKIIDEEVSAYFQGEKEIQEVCEIIQNRVQLYLDEL